MDHAPARRALRQYSEALARPGHGRRREALTAFFAPDAKIEVVHPFNACGAADGFEARCLGPLSEAFDDLSRTDYIAMTGTFEGDVWTTTTGYWSGHFARDWLGIPATGSLAHLRFGEFHKMEGAKAIESYVFLDLPELMIAADAWPITESPGVERGFTGYLPGPMTQDGLLWTETDAEESQRSYQIVTDMLAGLATPDEAWRPFWAKDMLWYGPAAFGSFKGIEHFAGFQVPFEATFEGWSGGSSGNGMTRHFTRFGDGSYTCSGGWPSLTGVQVGSFLGQPASGQRVFMRVCDWWRRDGDALLENWVFVDVPDVLRQLGLDIFADVEVTP